MAILLNSISLLLEFLLLGVLLVNAEWKRKTNEGLIAAFFLSDGKPANEEYAVRFRVVFILLEHLISLW